MTTPSATPSAWSFAGLRLHPNPEDGNLLVFGDLINTTGFPQELQAIRGTFYDAQGQVIAGEDSVTAYWPVDEVPVDGHMPFELTVESIQSAATFDLRVEAQIINEAPRHDFEFPTAIQSDEGEGYCLTGTARNPGAPLQSSLTIVAVLFDSQEKVINFDSDEKTNIAGFEGGAGLSFRICIAPPNEDVARYELRAWGR
jgi:hypothetical protein